MRIAILSNNLIPNRTGFGSAIMVWAFVETLVKRGHEVHLCCYNYDPGLGKERWINGDYARAKQELDEFGVKVRLIELQPLLPGDIWRRRMDFVKRLIRKVTSPSVCDFYGGVAYEREIARYLNEIEPDGVIAWTVDAVAAVDHMEHRWPRMGLLVDLDHLARASNRQHAAPRGIKAKLYDAVDAIAERKLPGISAKLLARCEIVIDCAAHHAAWLRQNGVPHASYLPVPVLDQAGPDWRNARDRLLAENKKVRLLLLGHVTGAATLPGLFLFGLEVLPEIERRIGTEGYEVNIIGGGQLPPELKKAFDRPHVNVRGFIEDAQREVQSSEIIAVPTPIELGFRTRIAESFLYGCCVVAHSANAKGMSEIVDGENALLADTGPEMAEMLIRCIRDPELRGRLGDAARGTFEQSLDGAKVCTTAIMQLEAITAGSGSSIVGKRGSAYSAKCDADLPGNPGMTDAGRPPAA